MYCLLIIPGQSPSSAVDLCRPIRRRVAVSIYGLMNGAVVPPKQATSHKSCIRHMMQALTEQNFEDPRAWCFTKYFDPTLLRTNWAKQLALSRLDGASAAYPGSTGEPVVSA